MPCICQSLVFPIGSSYWYALVLDLAEALSGSAAMEPQLSPREHMDNLDGPAELTPLLADRQSARLMASEIEKWGLTFEASRSYGSYMYMYDALSTDHLS